MICHRQAGALAHAPGSPGLKVIAANRASHRPRGRQSGLEDYDNDARRPSVFPACGIPLADVPRLGESIVIIVSRMCAHSISPGGLEARSARRAGACLNRQSPLKSIVGPWFRSIANAPARVLQGWASLVSSLQHQSTIPQTSIRNQTVTNPQAVTC